MVVTLLLPGHLLMLLLEQVLQQVLGLKGRPESLRSLGGRWQGCYIPRV